MCDFAGTFIEEEEDEDFATTGFTGVLVDELDLRSTEQVILSADDEAAEVDGAPGIPRVFQTLSGFLDEEMSKPEPRLGQVKNMIGNIVDRLPAIDGNSLPTISSVWLFDLVSRIVKALQYFRETWNGMIGGVKYSDELLQVLKQGSPACKAVLGDFVSDMGLMGHLGALKGTLRKVWKPLGLFKVGSSNMLMKQLETLHRTELELHRSSVLELKELRKSLRYTPHHVQKLSTIINTDAMSLYNELKPTDDDIARREAALERIRSIVHKKWPTHQVVMFGSSANGLGFGSADIDICITEIPLRNISGVPQTQQKKQTRAQSKKQSTTGANQLADQLRKLNMNSENSSKPKATELDEDDVDEDQLSPQGKLLQELKELVECYKGENGEPGFSEVEAILSARVPILKCQDVLTGIQCDICVDNVLAVYNTSLLKTYSQLDDRVIPLIYVVKRWAKSRQVNNSSKGTLSSYAWVLMVLYYLQHRHVPVLPNIQSTKLVGSKWKLPRLDNNFDVSFCADVNEIQTWMKKQHASVPRNRKGARNQKAFDTDTTVGQLFCEFFDFYAHDFDIKKHIVSIRVAEPSKPTVRGGNHQSAKWRIVIQDPFELEHNLGTKINGQDAMIHILRELRIASFILHTLKNKVLDTVCFASDPVEFPRACFRCGVSGHGSRQCPIGRLGVQDDNCFKCGQPGHLRRDCPNKSERKRNPKKDNKKHQRGNEKQKARVHNSRAAGLREEVVDQHKATSSRRSTSSKKGPVVPSTSEESNATRKQGARQSAKGNRTISDRDSKLSASLNTALPTRRSVREASPLPGEDSVANWREDQTRNRPKSKRSQRNQTRNATISPPVNVSETSKGTNPKGTSKKKGKGGGAASQVCRNWSMSRSCKFGDSCRYQHSDIKPFPPGF